jgi:hypothetical protein
MRRTPAWFVAAAVGLAIASVLLLAGAGCGGPGQPTFISFTGKGSQSAQSMKTIVDSLKKKFKGKVIFIDVNMDDPASKGEIDKYHVSMNPTFIILNSAGQVKETFMGAAQEDMLLMSLESFIPQKSTTTGSTPSSGAFPSSPSVTPGTPMNPVPESIPLPVQTAP